MVVSARDYRRPHARGHSDGSYSVKPDSHTRGRDRATVHLGLAAAALFWSGNFVVGRALREAMQPLPLNFWRWAIALSILLAFNGRSLWTQRAAVASNWPLIAALGLTGIAAFQTAVYLALETTSALNALLLFTMTPVLIALGAWLFLGERLRGLQVLGTAASLAGAVTLITHGDLAALLALRFGIGDLWMLAAMLLWASYSLLLRRRAIPLPQLTLLSASALFAVLMMLPLYLWQYSVDLHWLARPPVAGGVLYVAVFASIFAFLLWNRGVAEIGAGRAGMYLYLMPVFGALLSLVLLGEDVHAYQLAGGAFVLGGIGLVNRRRRAPSRRGAGEARGEDGA